MFTGTFAKDFDGKEWSKQGELSKSEIRCLILTFLMNSTIILFAKSSVAIA